MPRRPRLHAPGALYHIVFRGNDRQDIFFTPEDRQAWAKLQIRGRSARRIPAIKPAADAVSGLRSRRAAGKVRLNSLFPEYGSYVDAPNPNPATLKAPAAPGSYELRYSLDGKKIIARKAIEVTAP